MAEIYVIPDTSTPGKIRYLLGDWPTQATGTGAKTIEDAAVAAGVNGTVHLSGGSSGQVYSDTMLGTVLPNTMYTKAENITYRGGVDSGHDGLVTLRTTVGNRCVRIQHSAKFYDIDIDNINPLAALGAVDVQLAVSLLLFSGVSVSSLGTGGAGHGLYLGATVGTLSLDYFDASNCSGKGLFVNHASGVTVAGTANNCTFNHNLAQGVYGNLNKINFYKSDFSYNAGHGHWADAAIGAITSGSCVECTSHDNKDSQTAPTVWRHGFTLDGSTNGCSGYTISKCKSWSCAGAITEQDGANGNTVELNILESGDYTGIDYGILAINGASNTKHNRNIIIDKRLNKCAVGLSGTCVGNELTGNIIVSNNDVIESFDVSGFDFTGNCYYSTKSNPFNINSVLQNFAAWQSIASDTLSKFNDPLFVSDVDFHLQPTSPCLGAGTKITGLNKDIEGNPIFPPYNIGPFGLNAGALGVALVVNDGPPRNNITRLTGTSTTIDPTDTYQLADTNAWRVVTGWTAGTANDFFDADGVPIPFLGQKLIDSGIGYQLYYGQKGVAGYVIEQDAKSHKKIVKFLRVNTYLDSILYDPDQDYNW